MTHIYALVSGQLILYVGKTGNMKKREYTHRCKSNDCHSKYIPEYIDWTIRLLETVPDDQAITKEQYYYDTLKPLYNNKRPGQPCKESRQIYKKTLAGKEAKKRYEQSNAYKEMKKRYYLKKKSEAPVDVI